MPFSVGLSFGVSCFGTNGESVSINDILLANNANVHTILHLLQCKVLQVICQTVTESLLLSMDIHIHGNFGDYIPFQCS